MECKQHCRMDPAIYIGRAYTNGFDPETPLQQMGEYCCVFSVFITGALAVIYAMHGTFDRTAYYEIKAQLQAKGVKTVFWERHKNGRCVLRRVDI